jgi:hypothetical protein
MREKMKVIRFENYLGMPSLLFTLTGVDQNFYKTNHGDE